MLYLGPGALRKVANECVKQNVGPDAMADTISAIDYVFEHKEQPLTMNLIQRLGSLVDANNHDFRHTPVVFKDLGTAAKHAEIPRKLEQWCLFVNAARIEFGYRFLYMDARVYIREFLWIHPFKDGNGRVAFILHNLLTGTFHNFAKDAKLNFLIALPDFDWN